MPCTSSRTIIFSTTYRFNPDDSEKPYVHEIEDKIHNPGRNVLPIPRVSCANFQL